MSRRLIVVGPLPPPVHGVAVSTSLVLANSALRRAFRVEHLDTSDRRQLERINKWDVRNVALGVRHAAGLARRTRGERGLVYLPLSQGTPGFLRDSLLIHTAVAMRWQVVAHLRGSEFRDYYESRGPLLRAWIRVTLRRLDGLAVMGESLLALFDGLVPRERIAVVANGTPDVAPNGHVSDGRTVLFLGNLRPRKGVREALAAALLVAERRPDARFLFAGEWADAELERELRGVAAGSRVEFLPVVTGDRKRDLLLSADVLLFPPVEPEGHPRVVLEAMAAGLPVVATDRGAIAETVVDGETGYVLHEAEPEKLAERVLRLLDDDALRTEMAKASRARYLAHFTQEEADLKLARWLDEVAR